MNVEEYAEFRRTRTEAGLKINSETAEVWWEYGQELDPYGVLDLLPEEDCVGRKYFARAPGSDIWVEFGDLPQETCDALWKMYRCKLAFPAGLNLFELNVDSVKQSTDLLKLAHSVERHSGAIEVATVLRTIFFGRQFSLKNNLARLRDWLDEVQRGLETTDG